MDKHPHFKSNIEADPENKTRFICKACRNKGGKNYSGQYDFLDRHLATYSHRLSIPQETQDEVSEAITIFKGFRRGEKKEEAIDTETKKKLRIEYTGFLLKHHLPFSLALILTQFIQTILNKYDAASISSTNLSHITAGQIARSCVSKIFKDAIYNDLKDFFFT